MTELDKIKKQQARLNKRLKTLQESCSHSNTTKEYKGSSGNYDPTNDRYWINWHCLDCDKYWTTPQ